MTPKGFIKNYRQKDINLINRYEKGTAKRTDG